MTDPMESFFRNIPKAELHLHIEGTLEPELMVRLASRKGISFPFDSVGELRQACRFANLQSFLDIYYQRMQVLLKAEDFYELALACARRRPEMTVSKHRAGCAPGVEKDPGVPHPVSLRRSRQGSRPSSLGTGLPPWGSIPPGQGIRRAQSTPSSGAHAWKGGRPRGRRGAAG